MDNESLQTHEIALKESWDHAFTNPAEHSDQKFSYVVHSLRSQEQLEPILQFLKENGLYDESQVINLRVQPERVAEKMVLSCSVVSETNTTTFSDISLILEDVPFESVLEMSSTDSGTAVEEGQRKYEKNQRMTVEQLIADTMPGDYNEVRIDVRTHQPKVAGVLVKKGNSQSDRLTLAEARALAEKLNVPVVEMSQTARTFENRTPEIERKVDGTIDHIAVHVDGQRYVLAQDSFIKVTPSEDDYRIVDQGPRELQVLKHELEQAHLLGDEHVAQFVHEAEVRLIQELLENLREPTLIAVENIAFFDVMIGDYVYAVKIEPFVKINKETFDYEWFASSGEVGQINIEDGQLPQQTLRSEITAEELRQLRESVTDPDMQQFFDFYEEGQHVIHQCNPEDDECPAFDDFAKRFDEFTKRIRNKS